MVLKCTICVWGKRAKAKFSFQPSAFSTLRSTSTLTPSFLVKSRELGGGGVAAGSWGGEGWWGGEGGEEEAAGDAEMVAKRAAFRRDNAPRALAELGSDYMAPFKGNHPRPPPPTPDASSDA